MTVSTSVGYKEWMETDDSFCCFRRISCMKTMVVIFVWKGNYPAILNMCGLCTCSDVWCCVWGGSGGNGHVFVTLCEMFNDWRNVHNNCNNGLLLWSPHLFAKQKLDVVAHNHSGIYGTHVDIHTIFKRLFCLLFVSALRNSWTRTYA